MTAATPSRRPRPWWVGVVAGMASYIDAAVIVSFSVAIVIFQRELDLDELQIGLAAATLTLGVGVGAIVGGRLGDRLGRRPVFTVTMLVVIAGAALLLLAGAFPAVLLGAALIGLGVGADLPVSLSTISEAATDADRGKLLGLSSLLWLAGAIVGGLLSSGVSSLGSAGLAVIFGHVIVVSVPVLLGRLTIPESENWLATRAERAAGITTVRADRASVRDLLRAPYRIPFLALIAFYALTNLYANTTGQFLSFILVNYGDVALQRAAVIGLPVIPVSIVAFLVFMRIADKPIRFRFFVVGAVMLVAAPLTFVVFGVGLVTGVVTSLLAAVGGAFAFEGIMKVWTQQSFPTLLRTTAQGTIVAVARLTAAGLAAVTPVLLHDVGPRLFFALLATLVLGGVSAAFVVFRTRDQRNEFDLEERPDVEPEQAPAPLV